VALLTYILVGGGGVDAVGVIILNCTLHKNWLCIVEGVHVANDIIPPITNTENLYFINLSF
jgi:hypothetical protein